MGGDESLVPSSSSRSSICLDSRKSVPTPLRESNIASLALLCEVVSDDFRDSFWGWLSVSNPLRFLPDTEDIDLGFAWTLNLRPLVGGFSFWVAVDSGADSPSSTASFPSRSSEV
jgi:hypothetical protein